MEINKKGMYAFFEIALSIVIIGAFFGIYGFYDMQLSSTSSNELDVTTYFHTYTLSESHRNIVFSENLGGNSPSQDWSLFIDSFDLILRDYSLSVYNQTDDLIITECSETMNSQYSLQRLVLWNESLEEYRLLRLEVCN